MYNALLPDYISSLYIFKELLFQKIEVSCICGVEVGFVSSCVGV